MKIDKGTILILQDDFDNRIFDKLEKPMFFTIYKITNIENNFIYIGQHQTNDLNDNYMGSGVHASLVIIMFKRKPRQED